MGEGRGLEEGQIAVFWQGIERLSRGEPLEYLLGEVSFLECRLRVTPDVLIPRPETELLAERITEPLRGVAVLWDLCAGSGALGIALKKRIPHLCVALADISPKALAVARDNAQRNGVSVSLHEGDLFAPFAGKRADAIVCNPPYVAESEYPSLPPSVRDFEPSLALIGGPTGLTFYERLAKEAPPYLAPGGKLFLEIGATQAESIRKIFSSPLWRCGDSLADWSGRDRFFFLERE
jgi:release factor glutamine methyltransferase